MLALVTVFAVLAVQPLQASGEDSHASGETFKEKFDSIYSKELNVIPKGDENAKRFVSDNFEPRHAVAVVVVAKYSKRHVLIQDIVDEEKDRDDGLHFFVKIGVQFGKRSSIVMHRYKYNALTYEGKWTRSAVREWLLDASYPPGVNLMVGQFSPPKYFTKTVFGTVLIVRDVATIVSAHTTELVKNLQPYVDMYPRLKFTLFTKVNATQKLCDTYGVWSNDELVLLEEPQNLGKKKHSSNPGGPKFRMTGVTRLSIERFFHEYGAGTWPRYYVSAQPQSSAALSSAPPHKGIRDLSGWDYLEVVNDPQSAVLVAFVSKDCDACEGFAHTYQQIADRILDSRRKIGDMTFQHLVVTRIDQSLHEHPERIEGTPWMKFYPMGTVKKAEDVPIQSVEDLLDWLEEHIGHKEVLPRSANKQKQGTSVERVSSKAEAPSGIKLERPDPAAASSYMRTDESDVSSNPEDHPEL